MAQTTRIDSQDGRFATSKKCAQVDFEPLLAPAGQLVKAERRDRAEQAHARRQRKEERHEIAAERDGRRDQADDRVEQAREKNVAALGEEIAIAEPERLIEIAGRDRADRDFPRRRGRG